MSRNNPHSELLMHQCSSTDLTLRHLLPRERERPRPRSRLSLRPPPPPRPRSRLSSRPRPRPLARPPPLTTVAFTARSLPLRSSYSFSNLMVSPFPKPLASSGFLKDVL